MLFQTNNIHLYQREKRDKQSLPSARSSLARLARQGAGWKEEQKQEIENRKQTNRALLCRGLAGRREPLSQQLPTGWSLLAVLRSVRLNTSLSRI